MTGRFSCVLAALLVVLAGGSWLVLRWDAKEDRGDAFGERDGARSSGVTNEELQALTRLRGILNAQRVDSFATLEELVPQASNEDLWKLIEDSLLLIDLGQDPAQTVSGWLRAAAFAELGRRAPEDTLARIATMTEAAMKEFERGRMEVWRFPGEIHPVVATVYPALFSVYRGWADRDPIEACASLSQDEDDELNFKVESSGRSQWARVSWKSETYEAIFHRWAAKDLPAALAGLPVLSDSYSYRQRAWAGIIGGAGDSEKVAGLIGQWWREPGKMDLRAFDRFVGALTPEVVRSYDNHRIRIIGANRLMASRSLEEILQTAPFKVTWPAEAPLDYSAMSFYGARNPDSMIEHLPRLESPIPLAHTVAIAHPERTVDVLRALPGKDHEQYLRRIVSRPIMNQSDSRYPAPERFSRLPENEERLGFFLLAVNASSLSPEDKEDVTQKLKSKLGG